MVYQSFSSFQELRLQVRVAVLVLGGLVLLASFLLSFPLSRS